MDYFIIAIATLSGLYFHWWLYVRIKRWSNRDLALSFVDHEHPQQQLKRDYMLKQLELAQQQKVAHKQLPKWLEQAAHAFDQQQRNS
ncbi:hypothetical protein [Thiopseudomonas alkaliphila]|uniref:hypothetical protein n=1 Tax=Thiopseudomonas alkaliphila TaxID=1697053 RepID=UPI00069D8A13|nr:hypothetical protein [Thiopseudomonas alkaliphila]AKX50137.1 30S ribosomal protein S3 [Thiopseudomonas alkaliphila]AKX56473.1 30S ribosomal protein S3 [Thiopseudomonas alkaliphila]